MQDISDRLGRDLCAAAGSALVVAVVVVVAWLAYRLLVRVVRSLVARAAAAPLPGEAELDVHRLATRRAERKRRLETLAAFALRLLRWFIVALVVIVAISAFLPSGWAALGGLAGAAGTGEEVSPRRTVIRDFDGTVHSVPNGAITVASNFTRQFARVNERFLVAYGTDIAQATGIINRVGE